MSNVFLMNNHANSVTKSMYFGSLQAYNNLDSLTISTVSIQPSGHMTFIQRRINVDATS